MKPQDILLLLKILTNEGRPWKQQEFAHELGLSQGEVANSLERLRKCGLLDQSKKVVFRLAVIEFVTHAIKYLYPPELGSFTRGLATGHSAKPLKGKLLIDEKSEWVWPDEDGQIRGLSLKPIYDTVPKACLKDPALYELMSLLDSIRAGSAREAELAGMEFKKRVLKKGKSVAVKV